MKQPENRQEALEYLANRVTDYLELEGPCDKIESPDDAVCGSWGTGCPYCTMADAHFQLMTFSGRDGVPSVNRGNEPDGGIGEGEDRP